MLVQGMDQNGRLLESVVRARSAHSVGRRRISPGWQLAALLIVSLAGGAAVVSLVATHAVVDDLPAVTPAPSAIVPSAPVEDRAAANRQPRESASDPAVPGATAVIGSRHYVIQPGDTVQSIAERQGLRPETLASVNDLADPDLLQPGRDLLLPATDGLVHVVQPGETLRAIADQYGVDIGAIIGANELTAPDRIPVGLRMFVPGASPRVLPG
jgi:LysM repeat protein